MIKSRGFYTLEILAPKSCGDMSNQRFINYDGVLILDDSIEEKPYTDENEVNCWHYAHAKGRTLKGINILSCMIRYGEVSLPIGYEVI